MRLRVSTVLVGHVRPDFMRANEEIGKLFSAAAPRTIHDTVIVDNSRPRIDFERVDGQTVVVGGDNSMREFTAWDRGLAYLERERRNPDLIHLATSAYDALYTDYLPKFEERVLDAVWRAGAALGHIDYYDEPVEILGRRSQSWIRTSYVFAPARSLASLRSLVSFEDRASLFSGDPAAPFRSDAPICPRYQKYILSWLTGEGTGQGVVWHSRFDLSSDTLDLFETKAMAILNEHLFTLRLREAGTPVVDVTWLAGMLERVDVDAIDWKTGWQDQINARPA